MQLGIIYAMNFSNKHKDSEITFIGHSKGGAEAAAAALATNKDALLFNPATVNPYAYGLNTKNYTADMTAYIVEGEILNNIFGWMSTPIGDLKWLNSSETSASKKHSIRAVIEALD